MTRVLKLMAAVVLFSAVLLIDSAGAERPSPSITSVTASVVGDGTVDLVAHVERGSGRQRVTFDVDLLDAGHATIAECGESVSVLRTRGSRDWLATTNQALTSGAVYARVTVTLAIPGLNGKEPTILDTAVEVLSLS